MTYQSNVDYVDPATGHATTEVRSVTYRADPVGWIERVVVFIFSLIELLIVARILLLLLAARDSNAIVSFIYNLSDIFVAPFRGILSTNQVSSGATALDVAAIVALIGWFIIEAIVITLVRLFRPSAIA